MKIKIFETKALVGNWEQYTGHYRTIVGSGENTLCFDLPGRGGRVTKRAAADVHRLFADGTPVRDIARITGCNPVW